MIATTYHQITRFIQGYVDNEVNLNQDDSCKATCSDYKQTRNYKCDADTLCADQIIDHASTKCNGTVLNCEFIDEDVTVCPVNIWIQFFHRFLNITLDWPGDLMDVIFVYLVGAKAGFTTLRLHTILKW